MAFGGERRGAYGYDLVRTMKRLPSPVVTRLVTGVVDRVADDGSVFVRFGTGPAQRTRLATSAGTELTAGTEIVALLEPDRDANPVVVSTILDRLRAAPPKRVDLEAAEEITLRCGDASIKLCRDGSIEIYGADVESHAEGIQRIKGAQVRIN